MHALPAGRYWIDLASMDGSTERWVCASAASTYWRPRSIGITRVVEVPAGHSWSLVVAAARRGRVRRVGAAVDHAAAVARRARPNVEQQPRARVPVPERAARVSPGRQRDVVLHERPHGRVGHRMRALAVAVPVEQPAAICDLRDEQVPPAPPASHPSHLAIFWRFRCQNAADKCRSIALGAWVC
jgi:hypothetical protein